MFLEGDPRRHSEGMRVKTRKGEKPVKEGGWSAILPRTIQRLRGVYLRIVPPRAKETGVFLHQISSLISQRLFPGVLTSCPSVPMAGERPSGGDTGAWGRKPSVHLGIVQ